MRMSFISFLYERGGHNGSLSEAHVSSIVSPLHMGGNSHAMTQPAIDGGG